MTHEWLEDCGVVHSGNLNHQFCLKNLKGQWTQEASRAGPSICPSSGGVISEKWRVSGDVTTAPPPLQKSGSVTEHPGRAGPISRRGNQVPLKDGVVGATPGCSPFQKIQLPENKRSGGQGVPDVAASVPYTGVYGIYGLKKKKSRSRLRNSSKIVVSV